MVVALLFASLLLRVFRGRGSVPLCPGSKGINGKVCCISFGETWDSQALCFTLRPQALASHFVFCSGSLILVPYIRRFDIAPIGGPLDYGTRIHAESSREPCVCKHRVENFWCCCCCCCSVAAAAAVIMMRWSHADFLYDSRRSLLLLLGGCCCIY